MNVPHTTIKWNHNAIECTALWPSPRVVERLVAEVSDTCEVSVSNQFWFVHLELKHSLKHLPSDLFSFIFNSRPCVRMNKPPVCISYATISFFSCHVHDLCMCSHILIFAIQKYTLWGDSFREKKRKIPKMEVLKKKKKTKCYFTTNFHNTSFLLNSVYSIIFE